jgi:hypothetical protein
MVKMGAQSRIRRAAPMNPSFAYFQNRRLAPLSLAALLLALAGCATVPPPTGELAAAEQAVMRAADADADQYAPDILGTARMELSQAQAATAAGRNREARDQALAAAAAAMQARELSRAQVLRNQYSQRSDEIRRLREQLGVGGDISLDGVPPLPETESLPPATRLATLASDPRSRDVAAYEQLQARLAVDALAEADNDERPPALVLAARRVSVAELAAYNALLEQDLQGLERSRSELLVEASHREAERAREELEQLRFQARIQAEETARLRAAAEAEAAARQQAEEVIMDVGGEQARKLREARARQAELARQEAELLKAQEAAEAPVQP